MPMNCSAAKQLPQFYKHSKSADLLRKSLLSHVWRVKRYLPPMIHGLLRISCSRNPKTPQIRSFFYEKWLLFGVLRVNKSCFFMQAWNAWPFGPGIILWQQRMKWQGKYLSDFGIILSPDPWRVKHFLMVIFRCFFFMQAWNAWPFYSSIIQSINNMLVLNK